MAKTWAKWFDEVLPDLPGCPANVAENAIKNAAIDFCERSFVYIIDHDPIDAVQDQGEYDWSPGAGLKVVRAETVWYDGKPIAAKTRDEIAGMNAYWPDWEGTPLYYMQEKLEKLIVVPRPTEALTDAIKAKVAVKPSRSATSIDDAIWEKYLKPIASGAKADLFAMKRKPWTDAQLAVFHKGLFDEAIDKARLAAFHGHVRSRNNQNRNSRRFM